MSESDHRPPPLVVEGLVKRYGRNEALRGVDFEAPAGAVFALIGLNGAGKTTAIECCLGLQRFDAGRIAVLGEPPGRIPRTGGRIGAVFDTHCLHPHLTVRQAIEYARALSGPRALPAAEIEALLGLERYRDLAVRRLSHGNRRRASIAQALAGRPELLILDEPFAALDAGGVEDLIALLRRLHREQGATLLLASHQLPYLERLATHAAILHGGRIAAAGRLTELLRGLKEGGGRLRIRAADPAGALAHLRAHRAALDPHLELDGRIALDLDGAEAAAINAELVRAGHAVSELTCDRPGLAALFHRLTGGEIR